MQSSTTLSRFNTAIWCILIFLGIFLISCSKSNDLAGEIPDKTIVLVVDIENIRRPNVEDYVRFQNDSGNDPKHYTVEVDLDEVIQWVAIPEPSESQQPGDYVLIKKVKYEKGTKVLRGKDAHEPPSDNPLVVLAKVKGNESVRDKTEEYSIQFEVYKNWLPTGTYTLDPKLKVLRSSR